MLASGDKDVIYPVLKWLVVEPALLEKKAFVGYFLTPIDVGVLQLQATVAVQACPEGSRRKKGSWSSSMGAGWRLGSRDAADSRGWGHGKAC